MPSRREQLKALLSDGGDAAECATADLFHESPAPVGGSRQVVAIDFETYYTKDYSVKTMGTHSYVADPRFEATLVALAGPDFRWVGPPSEFDWKHVHGRTLLAHNAEFDRAVFERLQVDGIIPFEVQPAGWHCTAALAAYLQSPRDLAGSAKALLNTHLDKSQREAMRAD